MMDQELLFFIDQSRPLTIRDPRVTFISLAARFGDVETLQRLMREAVAVEGNQFLSSSTVGLALKRATQEGHVDVVRCLVEMGADINTQFKGASALHEAIKVNNTEMVEYLLSVPGLQKEMLSLAQRTPMMEAACRSRVECLSLLLSNGCLLETSSPERGHTAIHHTLLPVAGCLDPDRTLLCLSLLHAHGANLSAQDRYGSTPLHIAISTENVDAVVWFLRHNANLELQSRPVDLAPGIFSCLGGGVALTPLLVALHFSNRRLVELLVACGARCCHLGWTLPYCQPYERLHNFMQDCLSAPPSLQALCRVAVRLALRGGDVESKVASLACLPHSVRQYLLLVDELAQA